MNKIKANRPMRIAQQWYRRLGARLLLREGVSGENASLTSKRVLHSALQGEGAVEN
jgi:hypothetical protein